MSKQINIGGRIHSTEVGNVTTGANEVLDDTKGKKQNIINADVDAELLRLDQSKQNNLTFDNTPTENSTNPVTSGGVYAANITLHELIEAILVLIPSTASALNQLADKAFVNSSVSTATATFRGTYNVVTDLELSYDATHEQIATKLGQIIATADNNDYAFVQVPVSATSTDIRRTERYKFNGTVWGYEYDLNTSGFTAAQWEAINSAITVSLVQKLAALPTAQELAAALLGKQDVLTFDNVPTTDSSNPVKSGGVKSAINDEKVARENADTGLGNRITAIENVIPSAASSSNKLVDNSAMSDAIGVVTALIGQMDTTFNLTTTDGHITLHVTQENGVITSVQVQSSDIASAAALTLVANDLSTLTTRVGTAEGNITSLTGRMTTAEGDIETLQDLYNALQQSAPQVIEPTDTWPVANPSNTVIYRVIDRVNTPPKYYSDYMWNGTSMVLMATYNNAIDTTPKKDSANLITSGGVFANIGAFDVSEYHKSGGTLATYADLSAALAVIPTDYQKGGMSIKFVQSSDNKYVQFRFLLSGSFTDAQFANTSNWQEIGETNTFFNLNEQIEDTSYTATSARNAVPSNIRKKGLIITYKVSDYNWVSEQYIGTNPNSSTWPLDLNWREVIIGIDKIRTSIWKSGEVYNNKTPGQQISTTAINPYSDYRLKVNAGDVIKIAGFSAEDMARVWATANKNGIILRAASLDADNLIETEITIQEGEAYLYCNTKNTEIYRSYVVFKDVSGKIVEVDERLNEKIDFKGIFNLNNEINDVIYTRTSARSAVPSILRRKGLTITYKIANDIFRTEQCTSDAPSTTWIPDYVWTCLSDKYRGGSVVIAAYNSPAEYKASADLYSESEGSDIELINSVVSAGIENVILCPGTYSSSFNTSVNVLQKGIVIEGTNRESVIINGKIQNLSTNLDNYLVLKNLTAQNVQSVYANVAYENCKVANIVKDTNKVLYDFVFAASDSSDIDKKKANMVLSGTNDQININFVLANMADVHTVYLCAGTYHLDTSSVSGEQNMIVINKTGVHFIGDENGVIIVRDRHNDGNTNIVIIRSSASGFYSFKNINFTGNVANENAWDSLLNTHFVNCTSNGKQLDTSKYHEFNINIGKNFAYKTLNSILRLFTPARLNPNSDNRWNIHLYGELETDIVATTLGYDYVNYIGHDNCVVTLHGNNGVNFLIQDGSYSNDVVNLVKDITFRKLGCYNYYSESVVKVTARNYRFENCRFENLTCSPTPFDPRTHSVDNHEIHGDRRHGIDIDVYAYGNDCKLSFHNCVGIGSPYSFQNTRGWYFTFGSPVLYDCEGYGNGIGQRGHGIVCHRGSNPMFHNFHGYASKLAYGDAYGIRLQAGGQGTFMNCIAYGSGSETWQSLGVPYETLHAKCQELGITDESFFYDGTTVNYDGLTSVNDAHKEDREKLLASLTYNDVVFEKLNGNNIGGGGFCFKWNSGVSKLIGCVGYVGSGEDSCGLYAESTAKPEVIGGYFGHEDKAYSINFTPNSGQLYQTLYFDVNNLNAYTPYTIFKMGATFRSNGYLTVETVESTPQKIVDRYRGSGDIWSIPVNNVIIPAGTELKIYITDAEGNMIAKTDDVILHTYWKYGNPMYGMLFAENSSPIVNGCNIEAENNSVGISIETLSTDYEIKDCIIKAKDSTAISKGTNVGELNIFDCLVEGSVDNNIAFAAKNAINGSSNYSI